VCVCVVCVCVGCVCVCVCVVCVCVVCVCVWCVCVCVFFCYVPLPARSVAVRRKFLLRPTATKTVYIRLHISNFHRCTDQTSGARSSSDIGKLEATFRVWMEFLSTGLSAHVVNVVKNKQYTTILELLYLFWWNIYSQTHIKENMISNVTITGGTFTPHWNVCLMPGYSVMWLQNVMFDRLSDCLLRLRFLIVCVWLLWKIALVSVGLFWVVSWWISLMLHHLFLIPLGHL